jgi:hypothetical protein
MSGRRHSDDKVVRLDMPRTRGKATTKSRATGRAIRLTEEERQILLAELAEVTAALNDIQARTMELAAQVMDPVPAQQARPA